MDKVKFDEIVGHLKSSGFVFQGSELYGGLANTWDFGPLGSELKDNVKKAWWKRFVQESPYNVGVQSAILMNPKVWEASGHLKTFADPLMDCRKCKSRHRADKLIEDFSDNEVNPGGWSNAELSAYINQHGIACPSCGAHDFTEIRQFNLMFKTFQGVVEDATNAIYLRPETAQGIFVNFKNIQRSSRKKVPFGVAQIGKSFRNEITPGNFIFRTREFEQMELEFFCRPGEDMEWYAYWQTACVNWLKDLGLKVEHTRLREHSAEELSFYSKGTSDIEYLYPFGWGELWGIANRTDYDLRQHQEHSGANLEYLDPMSNEKYLPYCVEPSVGVERLMLAFLCDGYEVEQLSDKDSRIVLHLHPALAPFKACILPLSKQINEKALEIYADLSKHFMCEYDESGSIGKRYRRQDAIGTPLCITIDFDTATDGSVTVRNRDTMQQERIAIADLVSYINQTLQF